MRCNFIISLSFIIKTIFILSEDTNTYICPINTPLLVIQTNKCVYQNYDNNVHKISNKIIETQWLNQRNQIGDKKTWYMASDFSSYGDLIIESFIYSNDQAFPERFFYGIKSNGRPLFYNLENDKFINQIKILSNSPYPKFESELIRIKLLNDDKDYFISSSIGNFTIEIIDLNNNKVTGISQNELFEYSIWPSLVYNIIELINEEKTYLFCFIGNKNETYYLSLQKFQFLNADISQPNSYRKINSSLQNEDFHIYCSFTISCLEISKYNIIQCFYLNLTGNYTIGLFKEDTLDCIYSEIIDEAPKGITKTECCSVFYKSIKLKDEISILSYMLNKTQNYIYIQMKNLVYNKYLINMN